MSKIRVWNVALMLALMLVLIGGPGMAQETGPLAAPVTSAFTYQGQLNRDGNPVHGNCNLRFALFDAPSGGNQVGSMLTRNGVTITNGVFTIPDLNFGTQHFSEARWLRVQVQCPGDASFVTLDPRQALTAPPYAFHWGGSWSGPGTGLELYGGDVGISVGGNTWGVYSLVESLQGIAVYGEAEASSGAAVYGDNTATTGPAYGVRGTSASTGGSGVMGSASHLSGDTSGVYGYAASTNGSGVYGWAAAGSGTTSGVYGRASSTQGRGVYGWAGAGTGITYGVYGEADSTSGRAVYGHATALTGATYGVFGQATSEAGTGVYGSGSIGVYGHSNASNSQALYGYSTGGGTAAGVQGDAASGSGGRGVYGRATAASGVTYGVFGLSFSPNGRGVYGYASATGGLNYGVLGRTESSSGYGIYSDGNFGATGTKSAVVETQDYGWRHLYAVESPRVLFEDVGTAELANGRAVVRVDPTFAQTVNLEEPYQVFVTPLGDCGLYVAEKTSSSFTVRALDGRTCSVDFDYRIIATRLGYEETYLAPAVDPAQMELPVVGEVQP